MSKDSKLKDLMFEMFLDRLAMERGDEAKTDNGEIVNALIQRVTILEERQTDTSNQIKMLQNQVAQLTQLRR